MKKIFLSLLFALSLVPYGADAASHKLGWGDNNGKSLQEFNKKEKADRDSSDPCSKKKCYGNLICMVGSDGNATCGCTENSHCNYGWKCNTSKNECEVCSAGEKGSACNCPTLKQADGQGACECEVDPKTQS